MTDFINLFNFLKEKRNIEIPSSYILYSGDLSLLENINYTINETISLEYDEDWDKKLPDNLIINGDLYIEDWEEVLYLPNNLTVNGNLYLEYSRLIDLPNDLKVTGVIYVSKNREKYLKKYESKYKIKYYD